MIQNLASVATVTLALSFGSLFFACSDDAANTASTSQASTTQNFGQFEIPRARLASILQAASDYERPLLSDGILTFSEYETASLAEISCLKDSGLQVIHFDHFSNIDLNESLPGPKLTSRGKYLYSAVIPADITLEDAQREISACKNRYTATLAFLWAEKIAPGEKELQVIRRRIAACLREAGHDAPAEPSQHDLDVVAYPPSGIPIGGAPAPSWYVECVGQVSDEFEIG